jgi:NADPH-dependent ferric siderophore reductase
MSTKGRFLRFFSSLLKEGEVIAVQELSPAFRLLRIRAGAERVDWRPGDKMQVLFPSNDVRTYTPLDWSGDGTTTLLAYLHGDTPASRWARQLAVGQRLHFVGPQRSLSMPEGAIALIGDETSLAVAASYARVRPGQVRCIFELQASASAEAALDELGLGAALVIHREPGTPGGVSLTKALPALSGPVGITGGGELVERARAALRARGIRDIKTKAYWVEGRVGLD